MTTEQQNIIDQVAAEVRRRFEGEGSGHDWWHIARVWKMSRHLAAKEGADPFVTELGALLHDIADWKFTGGDESVGPRLAGEMLTGLGVDPAVIGSVQDIIATVSFKGAAVRTDMRTIEGQVVQDADRLDAIGAVGIARTFAYGGHANRAMYDPDRPPIADQSKASYMTNQSPTINHFYEKLLLLKDRLNTRTAKELAQKRHEFMEAFLTRFYEEWDGRA